MRRKDVLTIALGCMTAVLAWSRVALFLGWLFFRLVLPVEFDSKEWIEAGDS